MSAIYCTNSHVQGSYLCVRFSSSYVRIKFLFQDVLNTQIMYMYGDTPLRVNCYLIFKFRVVDLGCDGGAVGVSVVTVVVVSVDL